MIPVEVAVHLTLQGESRRRVRGGVVAHLSAERAIAKECGRRGGERFGASRHHEDAGGRGGFVPACSRINARAVQARDLFGDSANGGRDDRRTAGQCFDHHVGEGIGFRRVEADVCGLEISSDVAGLSKE